jgi:hypothetical protein
MRSRYGKRALIAGLGAALCAAAASARHAQAENAAYVVTKPHPGIQSTPTSAAGELPVSADQPGVTVVTNPIVNPAATVSRDLSQQPTRPDLATVRVGVTTIHIDPDRNYTDGTRNRLDQNHSLVRAQRLFKSLHARKAYVVVNEQVRAAVGNRAADGEPQPRIIIDARALRRMLMLDAIPESPNTDPDGQAVPMPHTPTNPTDRAPSTPQDAAADKLLARTD